jgi:hypothetical protein
MNYILHYRNKRINVTDRFLEIIKSEEYHDSQRALVELRKKLRKRRRTPSPKQN